jgi:large subunit ribosomal protein L13
MGKHKPIYNPSTDCGDYVVCVGCKDLHVTGKKMQQKKYYSHSTRPGSLKEITMEKMQEKWGGGEVLRRAVRGMLPKNRLRDDRMARLKCEFAVIRTDEPATGVVLTMICNAAGFEGPSHPYKLNILKSDTQPRISQLPEVQSTLRNAQPSDTSQAAPQ